MVRETEIKLVENVIEENMMSYSAYVLLQRAVPDVRDGMKPVYRRILYMMHKMGATKLTKSANIAGQVMKIHPHGSTYGTMVGMAQKDRHAIPFIDSKGNFGRYVSRDIAPAADRYTEAKLSQFSMDMMKDFSKGVVEFIPNYDGTMDIPEVLPTNFPTILLFSQSGIGVGFSSSTLGHNLIEVSEALEKYLLTGEHTTLVPDFPTGGYIFNQEEQFKKIQNEGRGTIRIRSKAEVKEKEIIVTEIPYGEKRERIIEKIRDLAKTPAFKEISEIKDLSGLKGQKIVIRVKRGGDPKVLLEKLYARTPLESTVSANNTVIIDKLPKVAGTNEIIETWLDWRRSVLIREFQVDLEKSTTQLNKMYGLRSIFEIIDEVIITIRHADEEKLIPTMMEKFNLNEDQAEFVSNMRLRDLNKAYITRFIKSIEKTEEHIEWLKFAISDHDEQNKYMINQFQDLAKKYGKPRMSPIMEVPESRPVIRQTREREVKDPNKKVTVQYSREGYLFSSENAKDPTLKPGDEILWSVETTVSDRILVYSKDCMIYNVKIQDLKDTKDKPRGTYIGELFRNETIDPIRAVLVSQFDMIVNVYEDRYAVVSKKVFASTQSKIKLAWNEKFKLIDIIPVKENEVIKLTLENGKTQDITIEARMAKGSRISQGVQSPGKKKIVEVTKA